MPGLWGRRQPEVLAVLPPAWFWRGPGHSPPWKKRELWAVLLTLEGVVGLGLLGLGDGLPGLHILSCCQVRPRPGLRHSLCLHALSRRGGGGVANWHRGRATGLPQRRWDRFSSAASLRRKATAVLQSLPSLVGEGLRKKDIIQSSEHWAGSAEHPSWVCVLPSLPAAAER